MDKALGQVAINAPGNCRFVSPHRSEPVPVAGSADADIGVAIIHFTSHIALYKNSLFSQVTQYSKAAPLLAVLLQLLSDEARPTAIRARAGFSLGACNRPSDEKLY